MKRAILLEDRKKRQDNLLQDTNLDLDSYIEILDNINGPDFTKLTDDFESFVNNEIIQYNVILAHESVLKSKGLIDKLKDSCKNYKLKLVLFSGGINTTSYFNSDYELLYLNSKDLYSNNLKYFLDSGKKNGKFNLLELAYGSNWKINLFFNYIEKSNNFIADLNDEDIPYEDFLSQTKMAIIKEYIDIVEPTLYNGWIKAADLKSFALNLNNIIKVKVYDAL